MLNFDKANEFQPANENYTAALEYYANATQTSLDLAFFGESYLKFLIKYFRVPSKLMHRLLDFMVNKFLSHYGPESLEYAIILDVYGSYLVAFENKSSEALGLFLESWSIMKEHKCKLTTCTNIIHTYIRLGDFKNAFKFSKIGVEMSIRVHGRNHVETQNCREQFELLKKKSNRKKNDIESKKGDKSVCENNRETTKIG